MNWAAGTGKVPRQALGGQAEVEIHRQPEPQEIVKTRLGHTAT